MPQVLYPSEAMSRSDVENLQGTLLDGHSFDVLVTDDADVITPEGEFLLRYRSTAVSPMLCARAYRALRLAPKLKGTRNRGMAGGKLDGAVSFRKINRDGSISKTVGYPHTIHSVMAGYAERSSRYPYCRETQFLVDHRSEFARSIPFIQAVDKVYADLGGDRYAAQAEAASRIHDDWKIPGTVFTTLTVNRNWQTAVHMDVGDFRAGYAAMNAFSSGFYQGGYLVFPRYRVAVDMRSGGVLICNVHEPHGNVPIRGEGDWERISCVHYLREGMLSCGSMEEERARVRRRPRGEPLR